MKRSEQWYVLRGSDRRIYLSKCTCATLKKGQYHGAGTDVAKEIYDDDGIGFKILRVCNAKECAMLSAIHALDEAMRALNGNTFDTLMFTLEDMIWDTMCHSKRPRRRNLKTK